jgi:hypothetical protein
MSFSRKSGIFLLVLLIIIVIGFIWEASKPSRFLEVMIINKTVPSTKECNHSGFVWVLNKLNIRKSDNSRYKSKVDYYGFVPISPSKSREYTIRRFTLSDVLFKADDLDMLYITDTYGVSAEDWYRGISPGTTSMLYGGLNQNDFFLLRELKKRHKLILMEFNMLASPTSELMRHRTEDLFQFKWSGWIGKTFQSLDTLKNIEIPTWVIRNYEQNSGSKWTFSEPGIVLIHENGNVLVLEKGKHLNDQLVTIQTVEKGIKELQLPKTQKIDFWFDIITFEPVNEALSMYMLDLTQEGFSELKSNGIPNTFPAIIRHREDARYYYFAGDFSKRTMNQATAQFSGVSEVNQFYYKLFGRSGSARDFYWNFYFPLISGIINQELERK